MDKAKLLELLIQIRDTLQSLLQQIQQLEQENASLKEQLNTTEQSMQEAQKEATFYEAVISLATKGVIDLDNHKIASMREIYDKYGEDGLKMFVQKNASVEAVAASMQEDPVAELVTKLF